MGNQLDFWIEEVGRDGYAICLWNAVRIHFSRGPTDDVWDEVVAFFLRRKIEASYEVHEEIKGHAFAHVYLRPIRPALD